MVIRSIDEEADRVDGELELKPAVGSPTAPAEELQATRGRGAVARWAHRLLLVLGAVLLVWVIRRVGPAILLEQLRLLGWMWVPLIALDGAGELMHAEGWRRCHTGSLQHVGFRRAVMVRQSGMAFNYLTPTANMGGEVIKGMLLAREAGADQATTTVLTAKLALVMAQLTIIVVASLAALAVVEVEPEVRVAWWLGTVLLSVGVGLFFTVQRWVSIRPVANWLRRRAKPGGRREGLADFIERIDVQLKAYHHDRSVDLAKAIFWHLAGFLCALGQTWIFLAVIDAPALWKTGLVVWALGSWFDLMGFLVPAGLGVQEGARLLIFRLVGLSAMRGVAFGLVLRISKFFWALAGLVCYALLVRSSGPLRRHDD